VHGVNINSMLCMLSVQKGRHRVDKNFSVSPLNLKKPFTILLNFLINAMFEISVRDTKGYKMGTKNAAFVYNKNVWTNHSYVWYKRSHEYFV